MWYFFAIHYIYWMMLTTYGICLIFVCMDDPTSDSYANVYVYEGKSTLIVEYGRPDMVIFYEYKG
jgi:hypothetical protein